MTKQYPVFVKRALALILAFMLMLSLTPTIALTADAVAWSNDPDFDINSRFQSYITSLIFSTSAANLEYKDSQAYDWTIDFSHSYTSSLTLTITNPTIKDASGNPVATYTGPETVKVARNTSSPVTVLKWSDFTGLDTEDYGTFTLSVEFYSGTTFAFSVEKTFRRVCTDPITSTVTSRSNPDKIFTFADPLDLVLNIKKMDGVATAYNAAVTVTNSSSAELLAARGLSLPASSNIILSVKDLVDLPKITTAGTYNVNLTLFEGGNIAYEKTFPFTVISLIGNMSVTMDNNSAKVTGDIYSANSDINLSLALSDRASKNQVVKVKAVGTLNGKPFESPSKNVTVDSTGSATASFTGTDLGSYGIFKDISLVICNSNGDQLWQSTSTLSFSRVLDTSTPGDLPLLNMNDHFTNGKGDLALKIPMMAQVGANMWRSTIRWGYVEKRKGEYAVGTDLTNAMNYTQDNGMQALIILAYNNDNDRDPDTDGTQPLYGDPYVNLDAAFDDPNGNPWLVAYANYCYWLAEFMAKRYPDVVVGFEIWNEWNHSSMGKVPAESRTGAHYAMVVQAASAKIRQVNREYGTNFKVIAGATAGDGYRAYETEDSSSGDFIEAMFKANGFFEAVDGVSFHTYASIETTTPADKDQGKRVFEYVSPEKHGFAARVTYYLGLVNEYNTANKEIEIWLTETGWSTNSEKEVQPKNITGKNYDKHTYGATELEQAAYLVQMYAWALADGRLDRIFWYDFMNDLSSYRGNVWANDMTESNYGLIHNWNNKDSQPLAYSAKPGYVTMCALSSMLGGATNGQEFELGSGIEACKFTDKNGKDLVVAWTTSDTTKTLSCSGTMTVTDMYGNAKSGQTTATLSECPIYITYSGKLSVG